MPTYCTEDQVTERVIGNLSAAVVTSDNIAEKIAEASEWADVEVGPRYPFSNDTQKFPDVTDSPSNGAWLQHVVAWYTVGLLLSQDGHIDRQIPAEGEDVEGANAEERRARRSLLRVSRGEIELRDSDGGSFKTAGVSHGQANQAPHFRHSGRTKDGVLLEDATPLDRFHDQVTRSE